MKGATVEDITSEMTAESTVFGESIILHFPKGFLWGAAASAEQTEGTFPNDGKAETVWGNWYKESPKLFWNQIGPDKTSAVYLYGADDIKRMKAISMISRSTF